MDATATEALLGLSFGLVGGVTVGVFVGRLLSRKSSRFSETEIQELEKERIELASFLKATQAELTGRKTELSEAREHVLELERTNSRIKAEQSSLSASLERRTEELKELQAKLTLQFEGLAHQALQKNALTFREESNRNLEALLTPLRDRLQEFQKKVDDAYSEEAIGRRSLKEHIERVVASQEKLTFEANHLARALRGDVRAQGNWGEVILRKLLEASGLRAGEDYIEQGRDLGLKDSDGSRQKPDVVIRLPDAKHLIVDSKVSLVSYERFIAATHSEGNADETARAIELKSFLQSIRAHIQDLSSKRYQDQDKLITPEFVLLFIPIEGAFSLALQSDAELYETAWEKRIVLVSPTTLLATLRTVASLWRQERQQKNVLEISKAGGALYDKFVLLTESLSEIGRAIRASQDSYDQAMGRLKTGQGNLISRVERLKTLGASATKSLSAEWAEETDS